MPPARPVEVEAWAPGRVVLIGDHTDHAGGVSLTMAVDLGTTVRGARRGDRVRVRSDQLAGHVDVALGTRAEEVDGPPWGRFVAAVAEQLQAAVGFEGVVSSTVPVGAGLSSSAALELALMLALGFRGTPLELARAGQRAEHRAVGVPCGLLDQLTSACGVEGHALLLDLSDDSVAPVPLPDDVDVVVVHSGQERSLDTSGYAERRRQCEAAAGLVGPLPSASLDSLDAIDDPVLRRRARHVVTECARVRAAADALPRGDLPMVGQLMLESHASLRDDFEVSTPALDSTVSRLMDLPGVLGARLTGAGFGGCVVALCERGALPDPGALTGRGWRVRPSRGAWVRESGTT